MLHFVCLGNDKDVMPDEVLHLINSYCGCKSLYPVLIHCCKRAIYNFCISQGSVAALLSVVSKTTVVCVKFSHDVACQKTIKIGQ